MLSSFIDDIEWMTFHQADSGATYPGMSARCHFQLPFYRDDLFYRAGIPLTADIARSVPKRRAEYLAGRWLAREVLARLGHEGVILTNGEDRAPRWPDGISGSLSHNADSVLCAAHCCGADAAPGVGLDIETLMSLERASNLWPGIVDDIEYDWLHTSGLSSFAHMLTLNFSAKESLFKALYPRVKRYFDFLDVRMVALDTAQQIFTLELLGELAPGYPAGRRFCGSYQLRERDVTTFLYC